MGDPLQRFEHALFYWFVLSLFFTLAAVLCASVVIPTVIWLQHAMWVDVDLFTLFAAVTQDGSVAYADSCWPFSITPIESARCHAIAAASFREWADSVLNTKGVALILEWLGELWLGWYAILLLFFEFLIVSEIVK